MLFCCGAVLSGLLVYFVNVNICLLARAAVMYTRYERMLGIPMDPMGLPWEWE